MKQVARVEYVDSAIALQNCITRYYLLSLFG